MKKISLEKRALFSLLVIIAFFSINIILIGKRNLWFEEKQIYYTKLFNADGLRVGAVVTLSGLRAGEIESMNINSDNEIEIGFSIKKALSNQIREDSIARVVRTFIIGEKKIDIRPGSKDLGRVGKGGFIKGQDSIDIMDLLSQKSFDTIVDRVSYLTRSLEKTSVILEKLITRIRPEEVVEAYDLVLPTLRNLDKVLNDMSVITHEVRSKKRDIPILMDNGAVLVSSLNKKLLQNELLPDSIGKINSILTPIAARQKLIEKILRNLDSLNDDIEENPHLTKKIHDALAEIIVTLKAMQKTWLLEDHVKDVQTKEK